MKTHKLMAITLASLTIASTIAADTSKKLHKIEQELLTLKKEAFQKIIPDGAAWSEFLKSARAGSKLVGGKLKKLGTTQDIIDLINFFVFASLPGEHDDFVQTGLLIKDASLPHARLSSYVKSHPNTKLAYQDKSGDIIIHFRDKGDDERTAWLGIDSKLSLAARIKPGGGLMLWMHDSESPSKLAGTKFPTAPTQVNTAGAQALVAARKMLNAA
ncbi:MAG: hypothetical protein M1549_02590 [Candidatus Dependentiae bacterium]|nr:hypothetical protein [Candidatus Dependentiae bacterium]